MRVAVLSVAVALGLAACGSGDDPGDAGDRAAARTDSNDDKQGGTDPSPDRAKPNAAVSVVKRYYALVDSYQYRRAWPLLPASVQAESGGYDDWRAGYRANLQSVASDVRIQSLSADGKTAVVALKIDAVDVDACTEREVRQVFSGTWTLRAGAGSWRPRSADIDKVSGGTPALTVSDCAPAEPPADAQPADAQPAEQCEPGYSPCLDPTASDYDCAGGSGDGPKYVSGPVQVTGSDRFGLDADGSGVGCE